MPSTIKKRSHTYLSRSEHHDSIDTVQVKSLCDSIGLHIVTNLYRPKDIAAIKQTLVLKSHVATQPTAFLPSLTY